ncbi:MAG: PA14 domain-containing protein [Bacteroidia bacterium]
MTKGASFWRSTWTIGVFVLFVAMIPLGIMQHGLDTAPAVGAFFNGALPTTTPGGVNNWTVVEAFPGMIFDRAMAMLPDPSSNRLYVAERGGKMFHFEDVANPNSTKTEVLDITSIVAGEVADGGLLNFAFHPRFGVDSNYIYLFYSARAPNASYPSTGQGVGYPGQFYNVYARLSRFSVNPTTGIIDPNSELIMINRRLYNSSHRGGGMIFAADSLLYIAMGEEFRYDTAQEMDTTFEGGVFRIDVDRKASRSHAPIRTLPLGFADEISGVGYFIPNDNPFLDPAGNSLEEYYTLGHRNPHRMAYDPVTDRIWMGEVGGNAREEVNIIEKGGNYGFPFREGTIVGSRNPPSVILGTLTDPVAEFLHNTPEDLGAIIGGFIYRGSDFPSLTGKYICGSYGISGEVWSVAYNELTGETTKEVLAASGLPGISSFGTDHAGEIYILRNRPNVTFSKLSPSIAANAPQFLSQIGAFTDLTNMVPASGIIPYDLNEPFWSDNAKKFRWLMIPNDGTPDDASEQIDYDEEGDWKFPVGSVLIKHFEMEVDENNLSNRVKLETRFIVHGTDSKYYGLTYKWNSAQTDAELLTTFVNDTFSVATSGFPREEVWHYPSRSSCLSCHNSASQGALGPVSRQLNSEITYPMTGRQANQLITLEHLNFFAPDADTTGLAAMLTSKSKYDLTASLQERALSYIDANCSSCHMPGTGNRAEFDARLPLPLTGTQMIYGNVLDDLGVQGSRIIIPGDTNRSVLYQRLKAVHSEIAMPPLAKNKVDTAGVRLIGEWIMSLDPAEYPQGTGLEGVYYNNDNFTSLVKTQVDPEIDFFWASSGPPGYSNPNHLTVRWTGQVMPLFTEEYTFHIYSDDGTRLWVNGQQLIDDFNKNGTRANSGTINLVSGQKVDIVVEYLQGIANSLIELEWESRNQEREIIPSYLLFPPNPVTKSQAISIDPIASKITTDASFTVNAVASSGLPVTLTLVEGNGTVANLSGNTITLTGIVGPVKVRAVQNGGTSGPDLYQAAPGVEESFFVFAPSAGQGTGLQASYFHNEDLTNLALTRVDPEIDFAWESGSPDASIQNNGFSVRWEGEIEIPVAGNYSFATTTDDGVRLWVNFTPVIDNWQDQANSTFSGTLALPAGKLPIVMEYFEGQAYAFAKLEWATTGIPLQIVPQEFLYPTSSPSFPVELLSFEATLNTDNEAELTWVSASDDDTEQFFIERSSDGVDFETIGSKDSDVKPGVSKEYAYLDREPLSGTSYYRIKQIGVDGQYMFSNIEQINLNDGQIVLYPNPLGADRKLYLNGVFPYGAKARVYDISGRELANFDIGMSDMIANHELDLGELGAGIYLVSLFLRDRRVTERVVLR